MNNSTEKYYPTFWQAVNLMVIYIFIQTLVDLPLAIYDYNHGTDWLYQPWLKIPVFLASTLFILWLGYFYSNLTFKQVFPLKRFHWLTLPAMVITFAGLQYFLTEINIHFEKILPPPGWFMELFARLFDSDLGVWGGILRIVVIAPIVEEVIFRGVIMSGLSRNYHPAWAIFFSALLFALFHLNPWQFAATFALGLILGWIRIRTGSVLACIAGHATHNGLVFLSVFYYNDLMDIAIIKPGMISNYWIHLLIFAFGIAMIWFFSRKEAPIKSN